MATRCALLFVGGSSVGMLVNWAVYNLAWRRRMISPWGRTPSGATKRRAWDRIPILGWLAMRREAQWHGPAFWIRPLAVEILTGAMLAALYWWEVGELAIVSDLPVIPEVRDRIVAAPLAAIVHAQFAIHAVLACLMLVGSLIDFDEKTIPDSVTVTGTLFGLVAIAALPNGLLPSHLALAFGEANGMLAIEPLHFAAPNAWPPEYDAAPLARSLWVAWSCFSLWSFGLLDRRWISRRGFATGMRYFFARLARRRSTYEVGAIWLMGSIAIAAAWAWLPPDHWAALLTSLVGVAGGGGYVWAIRRISSQAMGREALGFGDVTLMAMLGAVLGWQSCLILFMLAPLAGVVIAVARWLLIGDREIYFGPFLCLAAAFTVVAWPRVWGECWQVFEPKWLVPAVLAAGVAMLYVLLKGIQLLKSFF